MPDKVNHRWRAAVIGCGRIGAHLEGPGVANHVAAYDGCARTELVAVVDANLDNATAVAARRSSVRPYSDFRAMLGEVRPEIVSICTPDATHHEILRAVLATEGVVAILAEKPLALSLDAAAEIVDEAEKRAVVLSVNYSRRHLPSHARVRSILRQGGVGIPRVIRGLYINGTIHNGTHWFDLVRYFFGEVAAVRAIDRLGEEGEDPSLDVELELSNGAVASLHAAATTDFDVFEMDIVARDGRIRLLESGTVIERFVARAPAPGSPYPYRDLALAERVEEEMRDLVLRAVEDLVIAIETRTPACSGRDALAAIRIAAAARRSAATGSRVPISAM